MNQPHRASDPNVPVPESIPPIGNPDPQPGDPQPKPGEAPPAEDDSGRPVVPVELPGKPGMPERVAGS